MISFFEDPQKKIINIFYDQNHKLNKKYIIGNFSHIKIGKRFEKRNKNIIFSFNKLNEIKKFNKNYQHLKLMKSPLYLVFNASNSYLINKIFICLYLFILKKKDLIFFTDQYSNSFFPDFLYQIKFKSLIKACIYFFYQLSKNMFYILKSKIILIKT